MVLREDLLGMKATPRSNGSCFHGPDKVVMTIRYENNLVTSEFLESIAKEGKSAPKSHCLKYFYMRNHYFNLRGYQQSGYHWFYLSGTDEHHCTCGLVVPKRSKVETSFGHRELPSLEGVVEVFINYRNFDPSLDAYQFGAYCQLCGKGSLRNLLKKEVDDWIRLHKEDCVKNATK